MCIVVGERLDIERHINQNHRSVVDGGGGFEDNRRRVGIHRARQDRYRDRGPYVVRFDRSSAVAVLRMYEPPSPTARSLDTGDATSPEKLSTLLGGCMRERLADLAVPAARVIEAARHRLSETRYLTGDSAE